MCFIRYASTNDITSKKGKMPMIEAKASPHVIFSDIKKYLSEHGYEDIIAREDYFDIFSKLKNFEISFNIVLNEGKSLISISVYSEKRRFNTKSTLNKIYLDIEKLLERYR